MTSMNRLFLLVLLVCLVLVQPTAFAQEEVRLAWQVTSFDINATLQPAERTLNATATVNAKNIGRVAGSTLTFRLNPKATIKTVTVGAANATYRLVPETQSGSQRVTTTLPAAVPSGGNVSIVVTYSLPVESNTGLASLAPMGSQFLPLSFWYPNPNSPFSVRGADTAPFRLVVNAPNVLSSGIEKSSGGNSSFEQPLSGQPFLVQGDWDRVESTTDRAVSVYLPKGAAADERKQAENLLALAAAARSFYSSLLGPAPDVPVRLIAVRRGAGFHDAGTVLIETSAFRRGKIDSSTALLVVEALAHVWLGGQTPIRGEGSGVIREGLTRFLATVFLEKQFGKEAAQAELFRQRLSYSAVAKRDAPLARATPLDDAYFSSVPNKGAMVWRLMDRQLGRDAFMTTLSAALQTGKDGSGLSLAAFRSALVEKGGDRLKAVLDYLLDQVTDADLMIGLPQQRGAQWVSALRNLGATEISVKVIGTTDRGEQLFVDAIVPAKGFGEAVFNSTGRLVRAEIDPEKLYPQLDYANDIVPRVRNVNEMIAEASRLLSTQENVRAEQVARELLVAAPQMQDARILLGRALLAQNKLDEGERVFRQLLDEPLPTPLAIAWASLGLGQVSLKRSQAAEAARRFGDAVRADADYATSLAARAERIRAEGSSAPIDDSAKAFIAQLDSAILSGKKAELESRISSGELVRFIGGIVGTQPESWQTRVLRTEQVDTNTVLADVAIQAKELGQERAGTALLILTKASGGWKLAGIELFEVR